jgi:hypothetical protein
MRPYVMHSFQGVICAPDDGVVDVVGFHYCTRFDLGVECGAGMWCHQSWGLESIFAAQRLLSSCTTQRPLGSYAACSQAFVLRMYGSAVGAVVPSELGSGVHLCGSAFA